MATDAVAGGKVHLNGERVKAAHAVRVGDRVSLNLDRNECALRCAGARTR